jgi:serine/threonine-protein phosphatase 4 regulatory subunit 1
LPGILARIDAEQRRLLTVPSLVQLSRDPADPVRSGLLEVLGEVIYTFRDDPGGPPRELLDLFAPREFRWSPEEPATPGSYYDPSQNWFRDPERPIICAFNFPAVVLTLGGERWSELRDYYLYLANNPASKVLRTLAASLGEVAAIIGSSNAERDLVPVFLSSLRSSEQEVRGKIIEALPKFSESLTQSKRERIAGELSRVWPELGSWREREDLARLLGNLVSLVGSRVDTVVQIMGFALRDEVAAVRDAAVQSVSLRLRRLRSGSQHE